jgi:hypothetical protein
MATCLEADFFVTISRCLPEAAEIEPPPCLALEIT